MANVAVAADIVELDYEDLKNGVDLSDLVQKAFGVDGTGLLTVKNVPHYVQARKRLLPLSRTFATFPDSVKEKYVHAESYYSFGWSHGKEKLQGKPDLSKGSFYANPQYDKPIDDEAIIAQHPSFVHPNIWPEEDLPELSVAFKELGQIIVAVGELVARQCDNFVHAKVPSYPDSMLESIIRKSLCCKARLLHYFPLAPEGSGSESGAGAGAGAGTGAEAGTGFGDSTPSDSEFSSWCGWHNDHGSLTGLTSAMYLDADGGEVQNSDASSGLYIRNRKSELIQVGIPAANIAFQIGETAQVHSGGLLQATPHAVRGSKMAGVSRETFAVFMEPGWEEPMTVPTGADPAQAQSQSAASNLPAGVPPLGSRWVGADATPQSFGEFSEATHKAYY